MSLHNETLNYIIKHLGLPLMKVLPLLQKKSDGADNDAESMAKLLTSSVELGMAISSKMNVPTDNVKAESLRFKLTALGADTISTRMRLTKKEPAEEDLESIKATIDSLLAFSQNFSLDEQGVEYLEQADLAELTSKEIPELLTIKSLLPVIAVIDPQDRGILPNIAKRLVTEAEALTNSFKEQSQLNERAIPLIKQNVLELLAQCFIGIYPKVMVEKRPIGDVWQEFDRQKALILVMMDYLMGTQTPVPVSAEESPESTDQSGAKEETTTVKVVEEAAAPEPVAQEAAPEIPAEPTEKPSEEETKISTPPAATAAAAASPLGMFTKPETTDAKDTENKDVPPQAKEVASAQETVEEKVEVEEKQPPKQPEPTKEEMSPKPVEVKSPPPAAVEPPKKETPAEQPVKPSIFGGKKEPEPEVSAKPSIFGTPKPEEKSPPVPKEQSAEKAPAQSMEVPDEPPQIIREEASSKAKSAMPEPPPLSAQEQKIADAKASKRESAAPPSIFGAPKKEPEAVQTKDEDESEASNATDTPESKPKKPAMPPPPPMSAEEEARIAEIKKKRAEAEAQKADAAAKKAQDLKDNPPPVVPASPEKAGPPQEVPEDLLSEEERKEIERATKAEAIAQEQDTEDKGEEKSPVDNSNPFAFFKKDEDE